MEHEVVDVEELYRVSGSRVHKIKITCHYYCYDSKRQQFFYRGPTQRAEIIESAFSKMNTERANLANESLDQFSGDRRNFNGS